MDIKLKSLDAAHLVVEANAGIKLELSENFSFYVPNHKFMPAFKFGSWDGKVYLVNRFNGKTLKGLWKDIYLFAKRNKYTIEIDDDILPKKKLTNKKAVKFIEYLNLDLTPRDYQIDGFVKGINFRNILFESPTASGKSLTIFLISRYLNLVEKKKILIIVPTVDLTTQMETDFKEYSKTKLDIHSISAGIDKNIKADITISTWQSIDSLRKKNLKEWLKKFNVIIGDEAHTFGAKCLSNIIENCNAEYKIGLSGTFQDSLSHMYSITGLFGPHEKLISTKELIKRKEISDLKINVKVLKYSKDECKIISKNKDYLKEKMFLTEHEKRNNFIKKLTLEQENNTLVLFQFSKHGKLLKELLKDTNKKIFFIYGQTDKKIREEFRQIVENEKDTIILASFGVLSTGINIKNIHSIIFASPYKSKIKILQSIGRGLRIHKDKTILNVYDIIDDLSIGKKNNIIHKHGLERLKIYSKEGFKFRINKVIL